MYTTEERDTFRFCVARWTPDEPVLRALADAMDGSEDRRGVTETEVTRKLRFRRPVFHPTAVPRVLGELARDTREHGVPIAVTLDPDGTLRYWLSDEQVQLIRRLARVQG